MSHEIIDRVKKGEADEEMQLEKDFSKPWGGYVTFCRNKVCTPKILVVDKELSLQYHNNREEMWYLISGEVAVYRGKNEETTERTVAMLQEQKLKPGDQIMISKNTVHTAVNIGSYPAVIAEVSTGYADEDDIVRLYDMSGRVKLDGYPGGLSIVKLIEMCKKKSGL